MQGVTSSKNDGFSLTSGDFPSLGSEKDNSGKNLDSQGFYTNTADLCFDFVPSSD